MAGGVKRPVLTFNRTAAGMSGAMLLLAVVGLVIPALFAATHPGATRETTMHLSEGVAVVLGATYAAGWCSRWSRTGSCSGWGPMGVKPAAAASAGRSRFSPARRCSSRCRARSWSTPPSRSCSHLGWSEFFLGLMIIPLIGNAAEHATAVVAARKGDTDLALTIALGSSTQVALFVAPLLVLVGVIVGQPMHLVFTSFEIVALGLPR